MTPLLMPQAPTSVPKLASTHVCCIILAASRFIKTQYILPDIEAPI
jgi:hypothetical protein